MMKKILSTLFRLLSVLLFPGLLGLWSNGLKAQTGASWQAKPEVEFSGFMDVFYVYDFNKPVTDRRQNFLYNHNRHNEFNLNLGFMKLGLQHQKYRANLALQAGTYVNDNYAAEPVPLQSVQEANVGVSLNNENSLWLDAGIFESHLGLESPISKNNWTLTRSLMAESSPYFSAGSKLSYLPSNQWKIVGLVLNGWQRIQRLEGNSLLSFGTQVSYGHSERIALNWSTFIGTDDPDSTRRMRYFSNMYGQFQLTRAMGIIVGFDVGRQQKSPKSNENDVWFSQVVMAQLGLGESWKTTFRAEYYQDAAGVIIPTGTENGFRTLGLSLNMDYAPSPNLLCRIEGRWMGSKDEIFETPSSASNKNFIVGASMALSFSERLSK